MNCGLQAMQCAELVAPENACGNQFIRRGIKGGRFPKKINPLYISGLSLYSGGEGGITSGILPFALRAALRAFKSLHAI